MEFNNLYERKVNQSNYTSSYLAPIAYDALWTLAFALNSTNQMIQGMSWEEILSTTGCNGVYRKLVALENFTHDNELMGCVIRWNLHKTDFLGTSVVHTLPPLSPRCFISAICSRTQGHVQFNEVGSRFEALSEIFQYRLVESNDIIQRDYIALLNFQNGETVIVFVNNETNDTVYPGNCLLTYTWARCVFLISL